MNIYFEKFHYLVSEQLLAGIFGQLLGFFFGSGIYLQGNVFADPYVLYLSQAKVLQTAHYRFTLRVQQFFQRHHINVRSKCHCAKNFECKPN